MGLERLGFRVWGGGVYGFEVVWGLGFRLGRAMGLRFPQGPWIFGDSMRFVWGCFYGDCRFGSIL